MIPLNSPIQFLTTSFQLLSLRLAPIQTRQFVFPLTNSQLPFSFSHSPPTVGTDKTFTETLSLIRLCQLQHFLSESAALTHTTRLLTFSTHQISNKEHGFLGSRTTRRSSFFRALPILEFLIRLHHPFARDSAAQFASFD